MRSLCALVPEKKKEWVGTKKVGGRGGGGGGNPLSLEGIFVTAREQMEATHRDTQEFNIFSCCLSCVIVLSTFIVCSVVELPNIIS